MEGEIDGRGVQIERGRKENVAGGPGEVGLGR